jgi:hypothetical protein
MVLCAAIAPGIMLALLVFSGLLSWSGCKMCWLACGGATLSSSEYEWRLAY